MTKDWKLGNLESALAYAIRKRDNSENELGFLEGEIERMKSEAVELELSLAELDARVAAAEDELDSYKAINAAFAESFPEAATGLAKIVEES